MERTLALGIEEIDFGNGTRRTGAIRPWPLPRRTTAYVRARLTTLAILLDLAAITSSGIIVGVAYHAVFYHVGGMAGISSGLALAMGSLFVVLNALREDYASINYLTFAGHTRRVMFVWNLTFITALVFMFATRETAAVSRVSAVLFYLLGLVSVIALRAALVRSVKRQAAAGRVALLRVALVGSETELQNFNERYQPWSVGMDVVASAVLRGSDTLKDDLALAAATARVLRPDDVFILSPWGQNDVIDAAVAAFMNVPSAIHLGPQLVLDRFGKANVSRIGPIASLHIVRHPLTTFEQLLKRAFDVAVASVLLVVFTPLFLLIALAIKLDSPGPVLFVQRRYGFNQQTFRTLKFRSMSVAEDGATVRQAVPGDPRVTRVGRLMRRSNIDELPQLLNVLRGEMSLVGPRPHALAHNHQYARTIADYARRHNVKPGITGWAQIHGLRGGTTSDAIMRARVDYDLYYIDNWSLGLDLRILGWTLLSAQAFANAY